MSQVGNSNFEKYMGIEGIPCKQALNRNVSIKDEEGEIE